MIGYGIVISKRNRSHTVREAHLDIRSSDSGSTDTHTADWLVKQSAGRSNWVSPAEFSSENQIAVLKHSRFPESLRDHTGLLTRGCQTSLGCMAGCLTHLLKKILQVVSRGRILLLPIFFVYHLSSSHHNVRMFRSLSKIR